MEKSGEDALIEARRGKAEHLRSRGQNPFANDAAGDNRSLLRELREQFASALVEPVAELRYDPAKVEALAGSREYYVLGRLVSRRGFGKASFLRLRDMSDELQLFAKQDVLGEGFAALEDIDIADHLEARGQAMVTKTGELSLQVTSLRLLTKALRPLPDKFHGLTDVDLRYRRRYVDLVANPEVSVALRARSIIVQGLRDFLDSQGFLEVETPTLHPLVGGAAAKPFKTHHNALDLELFLRIAPELYLKRLLVGGLERVYEIGRCYRNEGISTRHNPEFTMLEFYQAYATYETLMDQAERLFRHVDAFLERRLTGLGSSRSVPRFPGPSCPRRWQRNSPSSRSYSVRTASACRTRWTPRSKLGSSARSAPRASTGATCVVRSPTANRTANACSSHTNIWPSRFWRSTIARPAATRACPCSSQTTLPRFRRWRAKRTPIRRWSTASSCSCTGANYATPSVS